MHNRNNSNGSNINNSGRGRGSGRGIGKPLSHPPNNSNNVAADVNTDGLSATGGYTGRGKGLRGAGNCPAKLSKKERWARAEQRKETEVALRPLSNGTTRQVGVVGEGGGIAVQVLFGQLQFKLYMGVSCALCLLRVSCFQNSFSSGNWAWGRARQVATLPQFNGRIN